MVLQGLALPLFRRMVGVGGRVVFGLFRDPSQPPSTGPVDDAHDE